MMQKLKLFICLFLVATSYNNSIAQSPPQLYKKIKFPYDTTALYIGDVDGVSAKEYKKLRKYLKDDDKLLGLKDLTESKYEIEVRLYEEPDGARLVKDYYCTQLFLDTIIKLDRKLGLKHFMKDSLKRIIVDTNPISFSSADSIFIAFASNNVFSIQARKYFPYNEAILINSKLINTKLVGFGCPHCKTYIFEYKIGNVFNSIYLEFMSGYDPNDTNNDEFTRKKKVIMNTLMTQLHIKLKN